MQQNQQSVVQLTVWTPHGTHQHLTPPGAQEDQELLPSQSCCHGIHSRKCHMTWAVLSLTPCQTSPQAVCTPGRPCCWPRRQLQETRDSLSPSWRKPSNPKCFKGPSLPAAYLKPLRGYLNHKVSLS